MKTLVDFFKKFIVDYGLGALIILGACALGFFDVGLFGGVLVSSKLLFLGIGVIFLIFYVPKLWTLIGNFFKAIWKSITGSSE